MLKQLFNSRFIPSILAFLGVIILPYVFTPGHILVLPDLRRGYDLTNFCIYTAMSAFFLYNYHVLVPQLYLAKKQNRYRLLVTAVFISLVIISLILNLDFGPRPIPPIHERPPGLLQPPPKPSPFLQIGHTVFIFFGGVFLSLFLRIRDHLHQVEGEKLQTELNLLKAQIQPHFLFNTLNSIYALIIQKSDRAADSVVMLSEFLRYIIREAGSSEVDLHKELHFIKNYLHLQEARLGETVDLEYNIDTQTSGEKIVPLILFSFVENAFKHGVNPEENSLIKVNIRILDRVLQCTVFNKKVNVPHKEAGGIGVQNTRERLMLVYPNQHRLDIFDNPQDYTVQLTLQL
jgi:hypothetical protein